MKRVITALLFLVTFLWCLQKVEDPDFPWHLKNGLNTIENGQTLKNDIYSYTYSGKPIRYYEVVTDLILALAYKAGGFAAVSFLPPLAAILVLLILVVYPSRHGIEPFLSASISSFFIVLASFKFTARPESASLVLFALLLTILLSAKGDSAWKRLALIPPLQFAWANSHMGGNICLYLLIFFVFCRLGERLLFRGWAGDATHIKREFLVYAAVLIATLALGSINPAGVRYFTSPFQVPRGAMKEISEWHSFTVPIMLDFFPLLPCALIFALLSIAGYVKTRRDIFLPLAFLVTAAATYMWARYAAYLFIVASLLCSLGIVESLKMAKERFGFVSQQILSLVFVLFAALSIFMQSYRGLLPGVGLDEAAFPVKGANFIKAEKIEGDIFNPLQYGGYLIFALYPANRVSIDGRTYTLYDRDFFGLHQSAASRAGWSVIKKQFKPDIVILPIADLSRHNFPLLKDRDYVPVYRDDTDLIWVANDGRYKDVIARRRAYFPLSKGSGSSEGISE